MSVDEEPLAESSTQQSLTLQERIAACAKDPRVVAKTTTVDICVGADLFLRETFNGNGRSCATCHPVANNFTIDPAFIATVPANDPLFIAELNPTLAKLEIPAQMRANSLILENVDGFGAPGSPPTPTTRFVLRSVPHNFSMGVSVASPDGNQPVERTGWSGDGAPNGGALKQFQQGAITQHYPKRLNRVEGTDFRLATEGELVRIDLFMRQLGRTNDLALATVTMSDARAEAGRLKFFEVGCEACHGNAGANVNIPGLINNFNFDTGVDTARVASLANFPRDGGLGQVDAAPTPNNPADGFGDGTFNTPPLVEAADTGPFFHTAVRISGSSGHDTAVATTIEEAIAFYDTPAFNNSPSGAFPIALEAVDIDNIGRFLRGINASFNAHLALKRLDAARDIVLRFGNNEVAIQNEMMRLAQVEIVDALQDLFGQSGLNGDSRVSLLAASAAIDGARNESDAFNRLLFILLAREAVIEGNSSLGTNLKFTIGSGTNMF